ncbi:MAG: hypothetical protein MUP67_02560 [Acidimicrobiia bacterium]|nr:hypothetical protein [Acidimicrobiia bacterium]
MTLLTPTTVWRLTPQLVLALDEQLGPPVDSYLNGTQTWLVPLDGDDDADAPIVEWRLHPVAGYVTPRGCSHYDLWDEVVAGLNGGGDPESLALGDERRGHASLWEGLECFPAYGDEIEPATLTRATTERLGLAPDAAGLVDHQHIGVAWEQAKGRISIVEMLLTELAAPGTDGAGTAEAGTGGTT